MRLAASQVIERLVQQGTHAELLAADGLYAELYETQFGRALASPVAHEG